MWHTILALLRLCVYVCLVCAYFIDNFMLLRFLSLETPSRAQTYPLRQGDSLWRAHAHAKYRCLSANYSNDYRARQRVCVQLEKADEIQSALGACTRWDADVCVCILLGTGDHFAAVLDNKPAHW